MSVKDGFIWNPTTYFVELHTQNGVSADALYMFQQHYLKLIKEMFASKYFVKNCLSTIETAFRETSFHSQQTFKVVSSGHWQGLSKFMAEILEKTKL